MRNLKFYSWLTFLLNISVHIFCSDLVTAQTQKFQKVYGGYSYDQGNDLIQMADTGYLLLCTSNSFSTSSDIYLLKVDKLGNYEWQHTYGGNEIEGACKIKFTNDGNIVLAGHTSSFVNNSYDFYLIKANMQGDTIWTKHYGGIEWDFANSMDTCADGGFIMAGKTYDTGNQFSDMLIIKVDANGNEQWQKKIGGNNDDVANAIATVSDGYLICGSTKSIGSGSNDIYVIKLDINGNLIWERTFGDIYDDEGANAYVESSGLLVISGKTKLFNYPNNYNTFLIKIRNDGSQYWAFQNSSIGTVGNQINFAIPGYNNGITSVGQFDLNLPGVNDVFIYINDSSGSYLNSGTYGGSFEDVGKSVIKTLDYGYAVIGTSNSFGLGLSNIYFIKTDTLTPSDVDLTVYVGVNEKSILAEVQNQIYPNPIQHSATISLNYPYSIFADQSFTLSIINQLGENVSNQVDIKLKDNSSSTNIILNNLSLANGMYYYNINVSGKSITQGKFTVLK